MEQSRENIPEQIYVPQKPIIPKHPIQNYPIPKLPERVIQNDKQTDLELDLEINRDIEENSPYQEGIISEVYQRPHNSQLVDPPELTDLVNTEKIIQNFFTKTGRYRLNFKSHSKKSVKGNTSSYNHKRDPSRDI